MRIGASLSVMLAFLVFLAPANAHWQYTRWNMTPAQVATASSGAVAEGSGLSGQRIEGYSIGDVGTYTSGAYHFDAVFHFKSSALALVHLSLQNGGESCFALKHDLEGVYGKPYHESGGLFTTATWQDKQSNNFAALVIIGSGAKATCSISYSPLATDSAKGL